MIDLTRHVATPEGVRRYHLPIGSPLGKRGAAKAAVSMTNLDGALAGQGKRGTGTSKGTAADPINCAGNVVLAAKLLSEGKHIRLNKEAEVGTLLDRLAFLTHEANRKGEKAPNIDLCRVSVPKTNLFCAQSKGIPRAQMPQLGGVPTPGSRADSLPKVRGGEVDILPQFRKALEARGIKVTDKSVRADHLKATQNQLVGPKVAGIYNAMKKAPENSGLFAPIFVTRDGYIIDGHHRWAAAVALEATKGTPPSEMHMKVEMIDMEIGEALAYSNAFAADWGIPQSAAVTDAHEKNLSTVRLREVDLTRHVATPEGVRRYHLPIGTPLGEGGPDVEEGNPLTVTLNGIDVSMNRARAMVADAYGWKDRDKEGAVLGLPGTAESIEQQDKAQIVARNWYSTTSGEDPEDEQYAASLWEQYQSPDVYGKINNLLRGGKPDPDDPPADDVRRYADMMFDRGGWTTEKPIRVYRALKSKRASSFEPGDDTGTEDWAAKLQPGVVFSDSGIVSTTAHMRFSQGWLMGAHDGSDTREPQRNDVVVEIRVPKGQRIVGGDPQFIETMLPPDTRLRVVEAYPLEAKAVNPLDHTHKTFVYTHVIAEVVQ